MIQYLTRSNQLPHLTLLLSALTLLLLCSLTAIGQSTTGGVKGRVIDQEGNPVSFAHLIIEAASIKVVADLDGQYNMTNIPKGNHTLEVSSIGYKKQTIPIQVTSSTPQKVNVTLEENTAFLNEVVVRDEYGTDVQVIESKGYNVTALDTKSLQSQTVNVNDLLNRIAGVRIRVSGGMGSDFDFSLDGMSGKSIRFFIDGIPSDYFGSIYTINNIPINLIDRVDTYKGAVPVELGADALGGGVNIVLKKPQNSFLEASYSYGSFNTHQATIQGQWHHEKTGFTTSLTSFYNYSDNDYVVWGRNVNWSDPELTNFRNVEFTKDNPAYRFNDDYEARCIKVDAGFTDKKWADQLTISFLTTELDRGVQHGRTMSRVYGDMRYDEQFIMPSLNYSKSGLLSDHLTIEAFGGYSRIKGTSTDTSKNVYDWRGVVAGNDAAGGERRNQSSLFEQERISKIANIKAIYDINEQLQLLFNYVYKDTESTGSDDFAPWHTIPFTAPQSVKTNYYGLSFNTSLIDDKLQTSVFSKHYTYDAILNALGAEENDFINAINSQHVQTGFGVVSSYKFKHQILTKLSVERSYRLPDDYEAFGNGVDIVNSPYLRPEQSLNINLGLHFGRYSLPNDQAVKFELSTFYRDTKDLIFLNPTASSSEGRYENIHNVKGQGIEFEGNYYLDRWLEFQLNATYLDLRNNRKLDNTGRRNIVFGDRLKNTPYLMSNAGLTFKIPNLIQKGALAMIYCHASYVHEFFLDWESLGSRETKNVIPTQFAVYTGTSYTFPNEQLTLAFDISNLFNAQLYDNFLLQKPGRAFAVKATYRLNNET